MRKIFKILQWKKKEILLINLSFFYKYLINEILYQIDGDWRLSTNPIIFI